MDALRSPPQSEKTGAIRKAPDFLPAYIDFLFVLDVVGGVAIGYFSSTSSFTGHRYLPSSELIGPLLRELVLGSLIAALLLREPRMAMDHEFFAPRKLLVRMVWRAIAAVTILMTIGLVTRGFSDISRYWVVTWCTLYLIFVCAGRVTIIAHLHSLAMRGALREAVAIVGAPDVAGRLATRLAENAAVVRVIDEIADSDIGAPLSDAMEELLELARTGAVDTVVVALATNDTVADQAVLHHLKSVPVQVTVCSNVDAPALTQPKVRLVSRIPVSVVSDRPLKRWDLLAKMVIDKIVALLLLGAVAPLMLIVALAIVCDSPGPVIFRQSRSGWGGKLFTIYKFRTMRHPEASEWNYQTARNDPRCTRVGSFLRRWSLDELPQLWNILRGDMSLVGPRPHADALHQKERAGCKVVAEYAYRHRVKPGLTGWAQIHGSRGATTTSEALRRRIAYDLYYIDNWSIWLDLLIILRTPGALLRGTNAF